MTVDRDSDHCAPAFGPASRAGLNEADAALHIGDTMTVEWSNRKDGLDLFDGY